MQSRRKTMTPSPAPEASPEILVSARDYFETAIADAMAETGVQTIPQAKTYLTEVLEHYISTDNLFDEQDLSGRKTRDTLAEMYLRAHNSDGATRFELLKKLGDSSLYISGFFSDSLQRKLVDVEYYAEMGGVAYRDLAGVAREPESSRIFTEFSRRFIEFTEVLNVIAQKSQLQDEQNILRMFDLYAQTGSKVIREQLLRKGILAVAPAEIKKTKV
jgi:hypothetical protein